MKITCQKSDLVTALTRARSIGAAKTPMPILSTVLLKPVGSGQLQLAATDLEVGYTTSIPAKIDGSDLVCVHAGDLLDRVKAMPDGDVKIDASAKSVIVTAKGSKRRFERSAMSGEEFPAMPQPGAGEGFTMAAQALRAMLEATWFAVSSDTSRPISNLLIAWEPTGVTLAATDGHRLSVDKSTMAVEGNSRTLVPFRAVGELRKMLDTEGTVQVNATTATTFFDFGDFEFWCRRPDASFPPYESFDLKRLESPARISVKAAVDALDAVGLSAGREGGTSILLCSLSADGFTIQAESADRGIGIDTIPLEWSGKDFSFGCNGAYLKSALLATGSEFVALSASTQNELDPIRIDPWDAQAGRSHYGIVMPARK